VNLVTRDVKILVGAVAAVVAGVAVALVYAGFVGGKELRYRSQAALLAAMPAMATGELTARGMPLTAPLGCWSMPEARPKKMRVACMGQTARGKRIQVIGAAEESVKEQYFTILVDGHPVVQNAKCLGADCRRKHG
jgi:hypothetical protein